MAFLNWVSAKAKALNARSHLVRDPYYRLQSEEDIQLAARLGIHIDANQATVDDWLRLPGLSIHQARTLVELVRSGVPLTCIDDMAAALSISTQRLKPLEPVIRFCYYDPESLVSIQPIDANTATTEQLLKLPGVDLHLARAIVQNRTIGPYRTITHLQQRLSLPPALVAELMHYLRF